jgi:hypothetical protein
MMADKVVLSFFDYTTNILKPWARAGYRCFAFDLKHPEVPVTEGNITRVRCDIARPMPQKEIYKMLKLIYWDDLPIAFTCYFPPCTDLSAVGVQWWPEKRRKNPSFQEEAMEAVYLSRDLGEFFGAPYFIENPGGAIARMWRPADYRFDPDEFGDPWKKRTFLWCGGGFKMPAATVAFRPVGAVSSHDLQKKELSGIIPDHAKLNCKSSRRAITFPGFAQAVKEANG